jgi:putative transposase
VRYACIDRRRDLYPVCLMCRLLGVSASGYYAWQRRPESTRAQSDHELLVKIRRIHQASKGVYGSPRVHAELLAEGVRVGRHKVARLMRLARLRGCPKRRFRATTQRDPTHRVARNLLRQNFAADGPNQRWAGDITYIATRQGWLYLAVVMDLYSRRIVGWATADHLETSLCLDALAMALGHRAHAKGLIHHSDRGVQYASNRYREALDARGIECSMSRRANCWDSEIMQSCHRMTA